MSFEIALKPRKIGLLAADILAVDADDGLRRVLGEVGVGEFFRGSFRNKKRGSKVT